MEYAIIILVIILICIALYHSINHFSLKSGCCDIGDNIKIEKKLRDNTDYPYFLELKVDGMHCKNCKNLIENTINKEDNVFSEVSLKEKIVKIYGTNELYREKYVFLLEQLGYKVLD